VPTFGNLENSVTRLEHAAGHIRGFSAGEPDHDQRSPSRIPALDLFLGTVSQSLGHLGLRAIWRFLRQPKFPRSR
jgi:hypothetical protein